jgi:hypothetical protein
MNPRESKHRLTIFAMAAVLMISILLGAALSALVFVPSTLAHAQDPGLSLGTQVTVTQEHLEGVRLAQAFVETGSDSPLVLCTFNENAPGFGGVRLSGLTLFCRQRTVDFGNGPIQGVAILTLLPGTFVPQGEFALTVTVFHEGALFYGDVLRCQGQC